jgi:NTP pyrophosphatase (non-canonical NTP hydrolase)
MITQEDIDAFAAMTDVNTQDYSYWVEDKIVTEGETRLVENTLGLVGEAGEVAEKIKKMLRDSNKVSADEIVKELGDVVFYATALANYFHSDLTEVLQVNMDKLNSRARRGVIKGSGDNR